MVLKFEYVSVMGALVCYVSTLCKLQNSVGLSVMACARVWQPTRVHFILVDRLRLHDPMAED